jgi:uncharacterized protein with HEPN domain
MRDERLLVKDILAALDRIDSYTKGMNYEAFVADEKTVNAAGSQTGNQCNSCRHRNAENS